MFCVDLSSSSTSTVWKKRQFFGVKGSVLVRFSLRWIQCNLFLSLSLSLMLHFGNVRRVCKRDYRPVKCDVQCEMCVFTLSCVSYEASLLSLARMDSTRYSNGTRRIKTRPLEIWPTQQQMGFDFSASNFHTIFKVIPPVKSITSLNGGTVALSSRPLSIHSQRLMCRWLL